MNLYATQTYWTWEPLATATQDDIVINWFSLQNKYIITSYTWEWDLIDFTHFNHPKSNWRWLLWYYQRWKKINLRMTIRWDNKSDFLKRLDDLRKNLFKKEVFLDIKNDWVIRRIKVNCLSAPKNFEHYNITFLKVEVQLETLEPFFYEIWKQTTTYSWKTAWFSEFIVNKWNAESEPKIYMNFKTWITWTNNIQVTIWNKTLTISETIPDNWALVIDSEAKTVKLNDNIVDELWEFPVLETDWNIITFTINWTFEVDINIINKIRYV